MKNVSIKTRSILLMIFIPVLVYSCQVNKTSEYKNGDITESERLITDTVSKIALRALTIDIDLKNAEETEWSMNNSEWAKVDFDSLFTLHISSSYLNEKLTFKIPLTAIKTPMIFTQKKEKNRLKFEVIQQFNTVYGTDFSFIYNPNDGKWYLEKVQSISYTHQGIDEICPYLIKTKISTFIDLGEMETGDCYGVKRE